MCEILVKAIKTLKSWRVAVVMFLLVAPALGGLFTALGAGQAGGPVGRRGYGVLVYSVHQHKKREAGAGLQGGTDVKGGE